MKNAVKVEHLLLVCINLILVIFLNSISVIKAENSLKDINFDFPLNNTFNLGTPYLADYSTTTRLKPIGIRTPDIATENFNVTFSGSGMINYVNKAIEHISNSSGIYIKYPDGIIYQKGITELSTKDGSDTVKAVYKSVGYQADEETVSVMTSSPNGELAILNNTIAVYKDMIEEGLNITTIAGQWK
jgi:hypothetical protein